MKISIRVRWAITLLFAVIAVTAAWWLVAWMQDESRPETPAFVAMAAPIGQLGQEKLRREYVLEVISLGVTLDKYRQGKLWNALSKGNTYSSIREQDPKKYPWGAMEKSGQEGGRSNDAMENGAKYTPSDWGVPTFRADSSILGQFDTGLGAPSVAGDPNGSGMSSLLFIPAGWIFSERPDRLMEKVFAFFDEHADVPYVVVSAADGLYFRNLFRPKGSQSLIRDG